MAQQETGQQAPNAALQRLEVLVGKWQSEVNMPEVSPTPLRADVTFEWIADNNFLVWKAGSPGGAFPVVHSFIGGDDSVERYTVLYSDSRGVSRIYEMSLKHDTWKLWREAPGFSQRFTGNFSADGKTITAAWERSEDGSTWALDFNLTYTRV